MGLRVLFREGSTNTYILIVADRMMPIVDGDALLQAMRSHPELRMIPVVMVTADAVRSCVLSSCSQSQTNTQSLIS